MQPWIDGNAHHFCFDDFGSFLRGILFFVFWFFFFPWQLQIQKEVKSGNLFRRVGLDKCLMAPFLEEVKGYKHPVYLVL